MNDVLKILDTRTRDLVPMQVVPAFVKTVDQDKALCSVELVDGPELFDVRLRAAVEEGDAAKLGIIIVPKVGSAVLVALINNDASEAYVALTTEVATISIKTSGFTLKLDSTGKVTLNEGELKGLVKLLPLIQKLNAIETRVNQLASAYASHAHSHPLGPTGTPLIPWTNPVLTQTQQADLENPKILQ